MGVRPIIGWMLLQAGVVSLLLALVCLGVALHETATIPAEIYVDTPLGYVVAPVLGVVGMVLFGGGWRLRKPD